MAAKACCYYALVDEDALADMLFSMMLFLLLDCRHRHYRCINSLARRLASPLVVAGLAWRRYYFVAAEPAMLLPFEERRLTAGAYLPAIKCRRGDARRLTAGSRGGLSSACDIVVAIDDACAYRRGA